MRLPSFGPNVFRMALIAAFVIAVMSPMLFNGITGGNDFKQHYQFAITFYEAVQNGQLYPGWSALTNFGFGDVGIRFYPPLAYYVLAGFRWMSGNWYAASLLAFSFWFFLGGVGSYLWAREWFSPNAALIAAFVYTIIPYHVNEIYNGFFYAEFAAAGVLPFCFLFVTRVCKAGTFANVIALAIAYAVLVLTHLPTAVTGSVSLLIYALASLRKDLIASIAKLAVGVSLGLLASMFYWIRMFTELDFLNHSSAEFISKAYDFHNNFLLSYFYVSESVYYERTLLFCDLLLVMTLAIAVPSAVHYCVRIRRSVDEKRLNLVILFLFCFFISTPLSVFVWEHVGILQKIQFPFRWLAVISVITPIFAASGFDQFAKISQRKLRPMAMIYAGLMLAGVTFTVVQVIMPAGFTNRPEFEKKINGLESAKSFLCWWPVWAKEKALENREQVTAETRSVNIEEWRPDVRKFTVSTGPAENVRLATFYYPHWKAEVNGSGVDVGRDDNGAVLIPVPDIASEVTLHFQEPWFLKTASVISVLTWMGLLIVSCFLLRRRSLKFAILSCV